MLFFIDGVKVTYGMDSNFAWAWHCHRKDFDKVNPYSTKEEFSNWCYNKDIIPIG